MLLARRRCASRGVFLAKRNQQRALRVAVAARGAAAPAICARARRNARQQQQLRARLLRQPRPDAKAAANLLAQIPSGSLDSPYVHRVLAWSALRAGQREVALQEVAKALADPKRQAPETRAELDQLRAELLAGGRP